jgi:hypothetical protein
VTDLSLEEHPPRPANYRTVSRPLESRFLAVDYLLEFSCEPKRRLGRERLLALLRRLARFRGEAAAWGEAAVQARDAEFELRPLAFHCVRCPANHAGREFGCFEALQLPLSGEAEEWLAELLPASLKGRESAPDEAQQRAWVEKLLARLAELPIDGEQVERHRGPGRLLERRKPAARRYGSLFRPEVLTTGQLLALLLFGREVPPVLGELVCRALGVWLDEKGEDGALEAVFNQPVEADDDPSVADLKQFLHALMVAASLDAPVGTELRAAEPAALAAGAAPVAAGSA